MKFPSITLIVHAPTQPVPNGKEADHG